MTRTEDTQPWPSPGRAWAAVTVLMLAYGSSFADRQIMTLLVGPIRHDLNITDTQFSLLSGMAFVLFYVAMGVPLAAVADRWNRRSLVTVGIVVWTTMTALCGLANSYWTLLAARIGVAAGEATLSPSAYSLIADYFPPQRRARAMAAYAMGGVVGTGLALIIGGSVIHLVSASDSVSLPLLGALRPWQSAFVLVALPGFFVASLMMFVKEPARRGVAAASTAPLPPVLPFLRTQWRTLAPLALGFSIVGVVIGSYMVWIPAILMRTWGYEPAQAGWLYGLTLILGSTSGMALSGWTVDRLTARGLTDAPLRVTLLSNCVAIPVAIAMPLSPNGTVAAVLLAATSFLFGLGQALPAPTFHAIMPNQLRARVMAIYFLIGNLIAFGVGPTMTAIISDYILHDSHKIGLALSILASIVGPIGLGLLWLALKPYRGSIAEIAER